MRRYHCWKTCLFVLLALQQHIDSASTSTASSNRETTAGPLEDEESSSNAAADKQQQQQQRPRDADVSKAIEQKQRDDQKQVENGRQIRRNWKRWVKQLLLQEHIQNFVLLDGLLSHVWKHKGRHNRNIKASVMIYLENDDRRAQTYALESAMDDTSGGNGMMAPLQHNQLVHEKLFEGMILQVDYGDKRGNGGIYGRFHDKLEIPVCQDLETASTALYAIDTYQLLEPLHLELGIATKHAIDFAYTPVEFSGVSHHKHYRRESFSPKALVAERAQDRGPSQYRGPSSRGPWWKWWFPLGNRDSYWKGPDEEYKMSDTAFAGGSHGEVWRGRRLCRDKKRKIQGVDSLWGKTCKETQSLIFKRLRVEQGYHLLEAGLREVHLGKLLAEDPAAEGLFTRYVNHFFREVPKRTTFQNPWTEGENDLELWIVFEDAGPSLRSYLYSPVSTGDFVVYQHSYLWTRLRRNAAGKGTVDDEDETSISTLIFDDYHTEDNLHSPNGKPNNGTVSGREVMKEVLRQILTSAAFLHERGIVHRDIKPSNCMCKTNLDLDTLKVRGETSTDELRIQCLLGDFSSSWDSYMEGNLYTHGPSIDELTIEYAPPEALLGSPWDSFSKRRPQSYDSWSIGVLALELLLGTPNVFSVDQRTTVLLTNKMQKKGASEKEIRRALYLAALSQFCIYMPTSAGSKKQHLNWPLRHGDPLHKITMVKKSCTLRDFHQALRARDPLGLGFDQSTDQLLHLIWQLLAWDPMKRITAADALKHPYFVNNATSGLIPGDHNALESQMLDPRMDFNLSDNVDEFTCPKCGRVFSDWKSCHNHANARKHAKFCTYDKSKLPSSVNAHSMLPAHPNSGYFDIQGRRPTIEDFHSIHLLPSKQFFGVFDGHSGNLASKFAASTLYEQLTNRLINLDDAIRRGDSHWKKSVETNVTEAVADIHHQFLKAVNFAGHGAMDASGTTATAVYVTEEAVIVASLGDSRAILSSTTSMPDTETSAKESKRKKRGNNDIEMSAIQLTKDHVASDPDEAALVRRLGGEVTVVNGLARVNEVLAITRSIGDAPFADVMSRVPHVVSMSRKEVQELCGSQEAHGCFIVLASDGLWDMLSNQEAIDIVAQTVASYQSNSTKHAGGAFQEASEVLTLEAYVRGSTDNIGVCVISLN